MVAELEHRYDLWVFDKHFPDMWNFSYVCFGHGFDYDINFEDADFIIKFVNDQHKSLFLLRWGEINATSTL